ncbi:MAG TPA: hypothetical protein VF139_18790 [Candidatus Polarisedimenticolaceae bacterium]
MRFALACLAVVAFALPASGQTSDAPPPPPDVVHVASQVFFPAATPGGANEGICTVANATDGDVRVRLQAEVEYSDGTVSRLTGNFDPGFLGPDGGFELAIFFVVPPDTAIGPAVFRCDVQAQSLDLRGRPEHDASAAFFEVVAP